MSADFMQSLCTACLALSASSLCVMLARRPMRRWFGAAISYALWGVVPLATVTSLLPSSPAHHFPQTIARPVQDAVVAVQVASQQVASSTPIAAVVWAVGALAMLIAFVVQYQRLVRSLGPLHIRQGVAAQTHVAVHGLGPLLLGLWRPVVVLPADFRRRYTARERRLILAHERVHLHRRDPLLNLMSAALQCVFWFNPVAHIAAHLFRFDQELACDDLVLRRHPGMPRSYADAILKTQFTPRGTALVCQWTSTHPLKERLMQLQRTGIAFKRRAFGRTLVGIAAVATAYGTWAAQSDAPSHSATKAPTYDVAVTVSAEGQTLNPHLRTAEGVPITIQFGTEPKSWTIVVDLAASSEGRVMARSHVRHGQQDVANPALLLALGQAGAIHLDADTKHPSFDMKMTVTVSPKG